MGGNFVEYETLVRELLESRLLVDLPGSSFRVFHNRTYRGKSGNDHQIDVAAELCLADLSILLLIECKHYQRTVGVDDVMELSARLDDIGAHKGVLVTTVGFQAGAVRFAKSKGIALVKVHERVWIPMHHAPVDHFPAIERRRRNLSCHLITMHKLSDVRHLPRDFFDALESMDCRFYLGDYIEMPHNRKIREAYNKIESHYSRVELCFDNVVEDLDDLRLDASGLMTFLAIGICHYNR